MKTRYWTRCHENITTQQERRYGSVSSEWWFHTCLECFTMVVSGARCHDRRWAWAKPAWLTDAVWTYWLITGHSFIGSCWRLLRIFGVSTPHMPSIPPPKNYSSHICSCCLRTCHHWWPHPATAPPNHYSDTLPGSKETTILLHNRRYVPLASQCMGPHSASEMT